MHGAETGDGVWGAKPRICAPRSVRCVRNGVGNKPENVSSKKPRVSELGEKTLGIEPRDVLPQSDTVANTTSTRGGAVNRPSASIRKTCPATGVDPNLAGLLNNLVAALISGPRQCASGEREQRGPVRHLAGQCCFQYARKIHQLEILEPQRQLPAPNWPFTILYPLPTIPCPNSRTAASVYSSQSPAPGTYKSPTNPHNSSAAAESLSPASGPRTSLY